MSKNMPSIRVDISGFGDGSSNIKANATVTIGGVFAVHGVRIINSKKGLFVSMPNRSYTNKDGETKYTDICHATTKEFREAINTAVLNAYEQALIEQEEEIPEFDEDGPTMFM